MPNPAFEITPVDAVPRVRPQSPVRSILIAMGTAHGLGRAVELTDGIAERWRASVHIVGALGARPLALTVASRIANRPAQRLASLDESRMWSARGELAESLREISADTARWGGEVLDVDLGAALQSEIARCCPSLVVVAGGLREGGGSGLGLSATVSLLRHTPVPVLVVPPWICSGGASTAPDLRTVTRALVATDFGATSQAAATEAISILRRPATLVLAHVLPPASEVLGPGDYRLEQYRAALPAKFAALENALAAATDLKGVRLVRDILSGEPTAAVREAAERHGVHVIAVGEHLVNAVDQRVLGSLPIDLVREAFAGGGRRSERPVLVVPTPDHPD
jgi:nucleotide-binding universal stress UspA family protein